MTSNAYKETVRGLQKAAEHLGDTANATGPETDRLFELVGQQLASLQELHALLTAAARRAGAVQPVDVLIGETASHAYTAAGEIGTHANS